MSKLRERIKRLKTFIKPGNLEDEYIDGLAEMSFNALLMYYKKTNTTPQTATNVPCIEIMEADISRSAKWSYTYAKEIKRGEFKLGEPAIYKSGQYAYAYDKFLEEL